MFCFLEREKRKVARGRKRERKRLTLKTSTSSTFLFFKNKTIKQVSNVAQVFANGFAAVSRKIGGTTAPVVAIYMVRCFFLWWWWFFSFFLARARARERKNEENENRKNLSPFFLSFSSPQQPLPQKTKLKTKQVAGLLTEIVTNNAAAALVYPVASRLGDALGGEPVVMASAVMLGASDAFVSPFGYQCNLMGEKIFVVFAFLFVSVSITIHLGKKRGFGKRERRRERKERERLFWSF